MIWLYIGGHPLSHNLLLMRLRGGRCRFCARGGGAVGGVGVLEEGVGDSENFVDVAARAEVAVDDGVAARGVLEGVELERRQHRGKVFEDEVLYALVGEPFRRGCKAVDLERYSRRCLGQCRHEAVAVVADIVAVVEPHLEVGPEHAQVCGECAVGETVGVGHVGLAPGSSLCLFFRYPLVHIGQLAYILYHFGCCRQHAVGIYHIAAADAPGVGDLHTPVVCKAVGYQTVWGHGGSGLVPVGHFYGGQADLCHGAVGIGARHGYPVAHVQAVVLRQLYAGHDAEYAVFENQHQYGGECAKAGKQFGR